MQMVFLSSMSKTSKNSYVRHNECTTCELNKITICSRGETFVRRPHIGFLKSYLIESF